MPTNERETDLATLFEQSTSRRSPRERMLDLHEIYDREQQALMALGNSKRSGYMTFRGKRTRAIKLMEEN